MIEEQVQEQLWDKKKILGTLLFVLIIGFAAYQAKAYFLPQEITHGTKDTPPLKGVKGLSDPSNKDSNGSSKVSFSLPSRSDIQNGVQQKIESLKQQISQLNAVEIASSSPQVQKVINDMRSLEEYPKNQAKEMCQKICSNL